jgi:tetratricopeptide (TPR) repeat protein
MVVALVTIGLAIFAENQRQIAVAQRDLAESSLGFLVDTFEVANPATENPRTITALTILGRASGRAIDEFRTKPAVAARLLRTTGDIYLNLGLQQESERDLRNALRLEPGEGDGRARTLLKLASIARFRGDANAMEGLVQQALAAYDADDPNQQELNALIAEQEAGIAFLRADYTEAARRFGSASGHYAAMKGDYRSQIAENLMDEAYALIQAGDFTRVDGLYARATAIFTARYGMRDVRTARAFHNQAFASLSAGRADAAIPNMNRALAIYQRVLEPRHPNLAAAEMLMGRIFTAKGRTDQALEHFARSRQIFASLYGADNAAVGDVDFYAAEAEAAAGRTAAALRLADNVKQIYDVHYGPKDADQAELLLLRARIMHAAGDTSLAARHCRSALALQQEISVELAALQSTKRQCAALARRN